MRVWNGGGNDIAALDVLNSGRCYGLCLPPGRMWTPPPVKPLLTGRTIHIDRIIDPSQ